MAGRLRDGSVGRKQKVFVGEVEGEVEFVAADRDTLTLGIGGVKCSAREAGGAG